MVANYFFTPIFNFQGAYPLFMGSYSPGSYNFHSILPIFYSPPPHLSRGVSESLLYNNLIEIPPTWVNLAECRTKNFKNSYRSSRYHPPLLINRLTYIIAYLYYTGSINSYVESASTLPRSYHRFKESHYILYRYISLDIVDLGKDKSTIP